MRKGIVKSIFSFLIAFVLVFSNIAFVYAAYDVDADGKDTGSSGSSATGNTITYTGDSTYKNIAGYRFSVVYKSGENAGELVDGTKIVNVYHPAGPEWASGKSVPSRSSTSGVNGDNSGYNKTQLIKGIKNATISKNELLNDGKTEKNAENWIVDGNVDKDGNWSMGDAGFATSLPRKSITSRIDWINYEYSGRAHHNVIAAISLCGLDAKYFNSSMSLLMEPLIAVKVENKTRVWTVSELAAYGLRLYGASSTGGSNTEGTFGYNLSNYICKHFPNFLYTTKAVGDILPLPSGKTELSALSSKASYGTVLNYGYGVASITTESMGLPNKILDVHYNANGGSTSNADGNTYGQDENGNITDDSQIFAQTWFYDIPNDSGLVNAEEFGLSREGYHFVGWGIDTDGSVVFDPNNAEIRPHDLLCENETYIPDWDYKEITLYAIWVPVYTVTFKFNGGTYNDTVSIHNDIYTLTNVPEGAFVSLITAEKEGYVISYWERTVPKSAEKYGAESLYEVTCDTTFVAHWAVKSPNENTQNILFDLNYEDAPKNLFAVKSTNTQNGITTTLNVNSNSIKLNGLSSELSETQYYFNPVLNAGEYLSGATNLRVIITHNSGDYFGSNLYFRVQANSETESFKKHNLLLPTDGVSTLDISLSNDGIINPKEITSLSCSIVSDDEVAVVLNNYDISIKILTVPKEENKYDNMTLPLGQMVIKNTVWSGNTSIPQRPGYNFVGWSTDKSEYKAFNTSSLISDDVILYAIWVKNSANVVNVRFDENYKEVTPNLYTVDTYNGQLWTEEYETLYENGFPQNVKTQYTTYVQSDSYGVRVDLYPNKNRIRLSGTLKEGTFTVPLSSLNLTLNKSDYFHLLIQKYGSYSLDMNFKNALFCVDVYDELGNELPGLCARINLADIKQGMPASYSISSDQIKELIGEKEFVNLRFDTYIGLNVKEGTTASLNSPFNNSKFDIAVTAKINKSETLTEDDAECNAYSKNVPVNNVVGNLQYPIRNGYKFCGWYTDDALTENFTEESVIMSNPSGYITVYAKWAKLTSSNSRNVRFISSKYYELYYLDNENLPDNKALDYDEASGCYKALKQDGVLYYALKNGEPSSYVVDSCLSSYTHINKDGTYTVKVVSKWVNNDDHKAVLEESLRIAKGENPSNKKTYTITSEQRKEIKEKANEHFENIKNGVSENSIFVNGNIDIDLTAYLKEEE